MEALEGNGAAPIVIQVMNKWYSGTRWLNESAEFFVWFVQVV